MTDRFGKIAVRTTNTAAVSKELRVTSVEIFISHQP
jgi:hypothetical protein